VLDLARQCLELSRQGLARRNRLDREGDDETQYLHPLEDEVARGLTPADDLLAKFHGAWGGKVEPVFEECAY
jgi:glutamate--cysteine ligase